MTIFLRLLSDKNKAVSISSLARAFRHGETCAEIFDLSPDMISTIPGAPFAYWVSDRVRRAFSQLPPFESESRTAKQGLATANDFRFIRLWWESISDEAENKWYCFVKGGASARFYGDVHLMINWEDDGTELKAWASSLYNGSHWSRILKNVDYYYKPGITWPLRGSQFTAKAVPKNCIFSVAGKMAFMEENEIDCGIAILNSSAFNISMKAMAGSLYGTQFESGLIQRTPYPDTTRRRSDLSKLARRGWQLRRRLESISETSHAFLLPAILRHKISDYDPVVIESELIDIQTKIDAVAFDLYGFSVADHQAMLGTSGDEPVASGEAGAGAGAGDDDDETSVENDLSGVDAVLAWSAGVAFGRFDWRLATGERDAPPEPDPFDPLPAKSPGMLADGAKPFHANSGILVDDRGHPHDLAHLVEEVLVSVDVTVPEDVRRWLQRDFFALHLQRYSKSRRKAPIYWPLSTASGSYTLWFYYPSLTSQTLYTAINDFIEPKLKQLGADVTALRNKGSTRSRDDEKQFEVLQTFELELIELRDTLLKLAPTYKPNHDDGVQISAAPLWPLFRHKPWQKVLKDTWAKLEKGDYDWAHLAMTYWPERVREKCETDKSLGIAHGLEDLYVEPEAAPKNTRKKKTGGDQ